MLINLYNANTEKEQISVIFVLLENFDTAPKKTANYGGKL